MGGNYSYLKVEEPQWLLDYTNTPMSFICTIGDTLWLTGSDKFTWMKDSAQRAQEVSYKWTVHGKTVGERLDCMILTDSLMNLIGLTTPTDGVMGTFSIIDKASGVASMVKIVVKVQPEFYRGDWVVLSEDGENTKCSFMYSEVDDLGKSIFRLWDNAYKEINGDIIPGKPLSMALSLAPNVGMLGSMTVITDQVAYVLDNTTLRKISELKDEFTGGAPMNFVPVYRFDCDDQREGGITWVATMDGQIYRRKMSKNYLGGDFVNVPYVIDEKGYKITRFGLAKGGQDFSPCYDEKNRRVCIMIWGTSIQPLSPLAGADLSNMAPVWGMPEGTEVLYLYAQQNISVSSYSGRAYTMVYNDKNGNTYLTDFVTNLRGVVVSNSKICNIPFPGGNMTNESVFLGSAANRSVSSRLIYSCGHDVFYSNRNLADNRVFHILQLDSKVTCLGYATTGYPAYVKLVVGCENGDLLVYDISNIENPSLISKYNMGGKVVAVKEIYRPGTTVDQY